MHHWFQKHSISHKNIWYEPKFKFESLTPEDLKNMLSLPSKVLYTSALCDHALEEFVEFLMGKKLIKINIDGSDNYFSPSVLEILGSLQAEMISTEALDYNNGTDEEFVEIMLRMVHLKEVEIGYKYGIHLNNTST